MDRCGPGLGEEITLVADQARTYLVAVETAGDAGTEAEVVALRAQCGDGVTDHGEACDDGNLAGDDGCDPQCRVELRAATSQESEPNNWHTEANVLAASESTRRVAGTLGGPCDTDHYIVTVPEGTTLSAVMTNGGEQPCTTGDAIEMTLVQGSTSTVRGMGTAGRLGGTCPSLEAGDGFNDELPAGEYHLTVTAQGSPPAFDYVLRVELVPAA
ncbi:MAG: hypothetical protein KDK70_11590 [Myxococcales bacterium]|nr:hypothetical protein [Myxococcales bacterium]